MRIQETAHRYARALFELASETGRVEEILNETRETTAAIEKDPEIKNFFSSPIVKIQEQKEVLLKFFEQKKISDELRGLFILLAEKRRFKLLSQIATAFQQSVDTSKDVTRGQVNSATMLFPDERQKLEKIISRYTGRKAVLEYHEDKSLLGGLVAQVGSFMFDDSLEAQLRLMRDSLKKRRSD